MLEFITKYGNTQLKDERGRKVLPQGAFKGGRVAGFNNTVGSAQGKLKIPHEIILHAI